ncbi:MAG: MaoC family dehydratase [Planctomycetes bacterium]|nr:MaoC family dehydratase [Planctomycetota bacterium]
MPPRVIHNFDELQSLVGQKLGTSDWFEITQERVNAFADGTSDHQWIHTDPVRAAKESPFGTTVAHGFLTLSLIPVLVQQIVDFHGVKLIVNYGLNRVRFPSAVKVGARVRMICELLEVKDLRGVLQVTCKQTFEIEGEAKAACVAETIVRLFS